MLVERICKNEHDYDGKRRKPGDKFPVDRAHILPLLAAGAIEAEEGEPGYQPQSGEAPVRARQRRNGAR